MSMPSESPQRSRAVIAAEDEKLRQDLPGALQQRRAALEELLVKCRHWKHEDRICRFYSGSFKVFYLQELTEEIVNELRDLLPGRELNPSFLQIISEGTGKEFDPSCNDDWLKHTRPIVEAFFHARFMLEMAARYARRDEALTFETAAGWAALLYLFNLR